MKSNKIAEAISGSYGKYFVTIRTGGTEYYVVWGEDLSDDRNDKLLLDESNNVLLFKTKPEAIHYILKSPTVLFDRRNLISWAEACLVSQPSSSYLYDLDFVLFLINSDRFISLPDSSRDDCWTLLTSLHLVGDYMQQVNDEQLLDLYWKESRTAFSDYVYDNFFWTIPAEELTERSAPILSAWQSHYPQFKSVVVDLLQHFIKRFRPYP